MCWGAVRDVPCPRWVGLGFSAQLVHPAVPAPRKRRKLFASVGVRFGWLLAPEGCLCNGARLAVIRRPNGWLQAGGAFFRRPLQP